MYTNTYLCLYLNTEKQGRSSNGWDGKPNVLEEKGQKGKNSDHNNNQLGSTE